MFIRKTKSNVIIFLGGRPRDLNAIGGLGFVLVWYCTKGPCNRILVMIVGQTSTLLYKWVKFARCILLLALMEDQNSKYLAPTAEQIHNFQEAIGAKYPHCVDVLGALD